MTSLVLVVEDNPGDEKLTLRALGRTPSTAEVTVTHDGAEALDYLFGTGSFADTPHRTPALVLLDLKLPRLDGREVLRRMRADERTRLIPVVVLTTSVLQQDIADCYALGANAYVRKPVAFDAFVDAIRALARFWLTINEHAHGGLR